MLCGALPAPSVLMLINLRIAYASVLRILLNLLNC